MNYSKTLLFITVVSVASAAFSSGLYASTFYNRFSDVPEDHWASDAISYVSSEGMMRGMNDTAFSPDTAVTRAQLAMVLYRISGGDYGTTTNTTTLDYARNAQRRSDVNTILKATYQYAIDNNGQFPFAFNGTRGLEICKTGARCTAAMINLSKLENTYLISIPEDPESSSDISTGYTILIDKQGRVTVAAPLASTETISVTR